MSEQDYVYWFTRPITGAENWDSVQSIGPFKPDGIQGMFYIHNWSVTGPICGMVKELSTTVYLQHELNKTFITLKSYSYHGSILDPLVRVT
ncbi:hypothetical protein C5167_017835 [Papaver somniferum]|uniref:Uncharacterized protein n=1 Tax=Papaver somniferum TaxID=3469 RepID=A0A4Y7INX8_PAPSO|nr:hypothetical protein C5167_017835 [Papaver somniferum]